VLIIPAIDLVGGKCVRLFKGDYQAQTVYAEDPVGQALKFQSAKFSRLHIVDLEGARDGAGKNREAIRRILSAVRIPAQIGGGVRTAEDVAQLLSWGAEYLILGTIALKSPEIVSSWVDRWTAAPFVISLDLRGGRLQSEGWIESSPVTLREMVRRITEWGVEQVISTDVERDGTLEQPNYSTYRELIAGLPARVRLIAAGGVCSLDQISRLKQLGVSGAIVGKAIYEGQVSLEDLASVD